MDWYWIATISVGALGTVLWWWIRNIADEMKTKLSKEEFALYLKDASEARRELRESIVKLFEKSEAHEKQDVLRFEQLTKDFNGGLSRLTDVVYTTKLEILRELNHKVDK